MKPEDKSPEVTLQECKNQVARKHGAEDFRSYYVSDRRAAKQYEWFFDEVSILMASQVSTSKDREIEELANDLDNASSAIHQLQDRVIDQSKTIEELKKLIKQLIPMAEDGHKVSVKACAHQEFLKDDREILNAANKALNS